jgi:hypothetical protein
MSKKSESGIRVKILKLFDADPESVIQDGKILIRTKETKLITDPAGSGSCPDNFVAIGKNRKKYIKNILSNRYHTVVNH